MIAVLTSPGTPTLRMSANSSQRGTAPRNFSRTIERGERRYAEHDQAAARERDHEPPAGARRTERRDRPPAEDQRRRDGDMDDDAGDEHAGVQAHVAGAAHRVAEEVEHADADGAAERDVRIGERVGEHLVAAAHPPEDDGRRQEHRGREGRRKRERQEEGMEDEVVGALAPSGAERPRDRRRDPRPHAAVRRLQDQHHPRKGERGAGERIRPDPAEEEAVEGDDADEGQEIEDVRRRKPQAASAGPAPRAGASSGPRETAATSWPTPAGRKEPTRFAGSWVRARNGGSERRREASRSCAGADTSPCREALQRMKPAARLRFSHELSGD